MLLRSLPRLRRVFAVLMAIPVVGIFIWLLYSNWDNLRLIEWKLEPLPFISSLIAYGIYIGIAAVAWGSIMRSLGSQASWQQHTYIYYVATLASRLPIPLGYVTGRLILYDERTSKTSISFGMAIELAIITISAFFIGFTLWPQRAILLGWKIGVFIFPLCLAIIHPRVLNYLCKRLKIMMGYDLRYRDTFIWLLLYCLVWVIGGCVLYLIIKAIYPISLIELPRVIGAWSLSGLVAILTLILPFSLGLRELTLSVLLASFLPVGVSALIAILARILLTLYELILAGIASLLFKR